jgi:hypothetical protein
MDKRWVSIFCQSPYLSSFARHTAFWRIQRKLHSNRYYLDRSGICWTTHFVSSIFRINLSSPHLCRFFVCARTLYSRLHLEQKHLAACSPFLVSQSSFRFPPLWRNMRRPSEVPSRSSYGTKTLCIIILQHVSLPQRQLACRSPLSGNTNHHGLLHRIA